MQIDAAQYATMSWEMLTTHNFLKLYCLGQDYLDKPPLIFWLSSLSFSVLGVNNFAYKLPSFFFALLAIFSTYRLTKTYYDEKTARMAAIMLATSQAMFLITNDVRTDTLLMGAVIFSIWQWAEFFEAGKLHNLLLGSLGVALALLAKGPIGLVATGAALLPHLVLKGKWKKIFDLRLVIGIFVIAALLTPMCMGLYQQFGMKGLKFYFWTQSFGRITGESEWNNHPDTFFLLHTTAWAFLPWSLFLLLGWIGSIIGLIRKKFKVSGGEEIISVSGFTLVLIMLSLSKYQLPHYIFVVYPLAAIMAAKGFLEMAKWPKARPWLTGLQVIMLVALAAVSMLLQYAFKGWEIVSIICLIILFPLSVWVASKAEGGIKTPYIITRYIFYRFKRFYHRIFGGKSEMQLTIAFGLDVIYKKLFFTSALVYIAFNFLLSAFYFPTILKYQPQSDFGSYVREHHCNFLCYHVVVDFALVFYAQQIPQSVWSKEDFKKVLNEKGDLLVYGSSMAVRALDEEHIRYKIIEQREAYGVSILTLDFLNPATRSSVCDKVYLLEVKQQ
jgi:4-amino-4-deoxy-L-arabinose transferase-like glycosyltransferase